MLIRGKPFQPSLMFAVKARCGPWSAAFFRCFTWVGGKKFDRIGPWSGFDCKIKVWQHCNQNCHKKNWRKSDIKCRYNCWCFWHVFQSFLYSNALLLVSGVITPFAADIHEVAFFVIRYQWYKSFSFFTDTVTKISYTVCYVPFFLEISAKRWQHGSQICFETFI